MNVRAENSFAVALRRKLGLSLALAAVACTSVGPDYEPPEPVLPAQWREEPELAQGDADLMAWWTHFHDPILDGLIERAARGSLDLRESLWRVREARALRGVSAADRFPTLDVGASYLRRGESLNTPFGAFVPDSDLYTVGFDAAWELDLWGRVRRSVEAADAELEATFEDARDVAITVAAETAVNYVELRAFQTRSEIARTNVTLQEETLALVRARFEAGLVGERDVAQASSIVQSTRSRVPTFEIGMRAAENRLAVLLGLTPGALAAELGTTQAIPVPPLTLAVGVPAELLRRRADIRRTERLLAAETARIGVVEADRYPRLALFGNLGLASDDLSDLFDADSNVFGIGPSIRWNIFDGGRRRADVEAQDARMEQALVRWERAVLTALEETENAMTAFVREQARRRSLLEATAQSRLAVELARAQYTEGLSDFQSVLDSQRAVAVLEDELAQSDAAIATNLVALYKALGGGWEQMHGGPLQAGAP